VAGLIDLANVPYDGYSVRPDHVVAQVRAGSPAAEAGLKVGDRVVRVNGIPLDDARAIDRMPRAALGETRTLGVESGGATRNVAITYAGLPVSDVALKCAGFLIALACVAFGLLAYWKAPGKASLLLALTGVLWSCEFLPWPYIESYGLRQVVATLEWSCIAFGFATLLHTLAVFPKVKAPLRWRMATLLLYTPASAIAVLFAWIFLVESPSSGKWASILGAATGAYVFLFLLLMLGAFIHSYATASPADRKRMGLHLALAGVLLGFGPAIMVGLLQLLAPSVALPGAQFDSFPTVLALGALAVTMVRAASPTRRTVA
jgi:PDZ domain